MPDKLQVLNEEFAQAIIFKRNQIMKDDEDDDRKTGQTAEEKKGTPIERATRKVMQEYFDKDQLNMLPKPIMQTSLLVNMKNNRELPMYGFKQSMNIVQRSVSSSKHPGDGNKNKTTEDLDNFVNDLEQLYANNNMAVVNSRIRFEHKDLYI